MNANEFRIDYNNTCDILVPRTLICSGSLESIGLYSKLVERDDVIISTKDLAKSLDISEIRLKGLLSELERLGMINIQPRLDQKKNVIGFIYGIYSPMAVKRKSEDLEMVLNANESFSPNVLSPNNNNKPLSLNPNHKVNLNPLKSIRVQDACLREEFNLSHRWTFSQYWQHQDILSQFPDFYQLCDSIRNFCPWVFEHLEVTIKYYITLRKQYDNKTLLLTTTSLENYKKRDKYKNWGSVMTKWLNR